MRKTIDPWKFTAGNYSIVWQGPVTTTMHHPQDDCEEEHRFDFMGTCVNQHVMAACWNNDDAKAMGLVPDMIPIHFIICREVPASSTARDLIMNESFQIPMANILQHHLMIIDDVVNSPAQIKEITIKIAIPNTELPSMEASYRDPDGDVHDIQETIVDDTWEAHRNRVHMLLICLTADVNAVAAIRNIIPEMDLYWKAYVHQMYPSEYELFTANLGDCIQEIKAGRVTSAESTNTYHDLIKPRYNSKILTMVSEGMAIVGQQLDSFDEATCKDIYETGNLNAANRDVTIVCDKIPGKEEAEPTHDEDCTPPEDSEKSSREVEETKIAQLLKEETESNPCFNFNNYKPGNTVPGWALDNTKAGFAQVKPEYKEIFDEK